MLEKIVRFYTKIAVKFYIPILMLVGVLLSISINPTIALFKNIQTDFSSLLPRSYPSVQLMDEVDAKFGTMKNVMVIFETKNPDAIKKMLPLLSKEFESDEEVGSVDYKKRGYDFFYEHKLLFPSVEDLEEMRDKIDRRIQREKLGSLYVSFEEDEDEDADVDEGFGNLKKKYRSLYPGKLTNEFITDEEETVFVLGVTPKQEKANVSAFSKFYKKFEQKIEAFDPKRFDPDVKIHYSGGIVSSTVEYESLIRDLKVAGIISGILILVCIIAYFFSFRAILFVGIPLAIGIFWNFALARLIIGHLNMTTAFLFSILFGLGIDFGIHLYSRYTEERENGRTLFDSLYAMIFHVGRSSFTAGATTAAAFLILAINDFKGFSEFGLIAGIGIMISLFAYLTILPAMCVLEESIWFLRRKKFKLRAWYLDRIVKIPPKKLLLISGSLLLIFLLSISFGLNFDYDFSNFSAKDKKLGIAKELYRRINPSKAIPSVVLVHSKEEARVVKSAVLKRRDENKNSLIKASKNLYDLVPENQEEKLPIMEEIRELLNDETIEKLIKGEKKEDLDDLKKSTFAKPFTMDALPDSLKHSFASKETGEKDQLVYIFAENEVDLKNGKLAMQFADQIRNIPTEKGTFHAVSSSVIFADVLSVMLSDSARAIFLSFIAVLLLLLIDFKSIKKMILTALPLTIGFIMMLGIMVISQQKLNFFNMIVLPAVLGMGVDGGVHFFHRFEEEGYKNLSKVVHYTGGAIVLTTVTTMAGFAGMIAASHLGLRSIGIAANIGMFSCLIGSVIIFPAVLSLIYGKKEDVVSCPE
ncbi:MAG: MMPL family transporter [Pseudomonadota bacterium]